MDFRGIIYTPINEQGVIVLFSKIAEDLGFQIESIQQKFPDCAAMRKVSKDKSRRVIIEFEYDSRNFLDHEHSIDQCDIIVCWKHTWFDYPKDKIEIIYLEEIVKELKDMDYETSKSDIIEEEKIPLSKEDIEIRELFNRLNTPQEIISLFYYLEPKVKAINDLIWLNVIKYSITFNSSRKFLHIDPQKSALKIWYYEHGDWPYIKVSSEEDIDKFMIKIKKSYDIRGLTGVEIREIYTEEQHLEGKSDYIQELYQNLKMEILKINSKIEMKPVKTYIGFKLEANLLSFLHIKSSKIWIYLAKLKENFEDPRKILFNVPESHRWGKISRFELENREDIPYATDLIRQSFKIFKKKLD